MQEKLSSETLGSQGSFLHVRAAAPPVNRRIQPMKDSSSSSSIRLGGAVISDRIVAALLENYQPPEGIRIPEALIPYTGFDIIK